MDFPSPFSQSESSPKDSQFLAGSKKISKTKGKGKGNASSSSPQKNYDKTPTALKEGIMRAIMDELATLRKENPNYSFEYEIKYDLKKWRGYLGDLNHKEFNSILTKVMPSFKPDLVLCQQNLTQLRKKVKGWFDNEKKAETRGGGLVRDEELPEFKRVLVKIINKLHSMRTRSFEYLRNQVIPVIEQIHKKSLDRKTKNNMFSKRFWHSFLHREENADLKALWEGIPKKNARRPGAATALESASTESDSDFSLDNSRKNSGYQEIPECENVFDNNEQQQEGAESVDSPFMTFHMNVDFDSLKRDIEDLTSSPDLPTTELTNQSSSPVPPVQDVKNIMEEEQDGTDFAFAGELTFDWKDVQQTQVVWLNFFKDCENDVQSPNENLLLSQNIDDDDNNLNSWELNLGY